MDNLTDIEQNDVMKSFTKTDDILKDMCGIIESSQNSAYRAVNTAHIQRNWLIGYRMRKKNWKVAKDPNTV